jgi:hypothetical protein
VTNLTEMVQPGVSEFIERESMMSDAMDEISEDYSLCVSCCRIRTNDTNKFYILKGHTICRTDPFFMQTCCDICATDYVICHECSENVLLYSLGDKIMCHSCFIGSVRGLRCSRAMDIDIVGCVSSSRKRSCESSCESSSKRLRM